MRAIFLLVLLLKGVPLFSQQYNFRSWTLEDGLPQSQVNDVIQDKKGQLWLATRGGVSRFNGAEFYSYTKHHGLKSNNIQCLLQDRKGHIWIGTYDQGISSYNGYKFTNYTLPAGSINDLSEDGIGQIWAATDSGLFYLDDNAFIKYNELPTQVYTSVICAPQTELWVGSKDKGLYHISQSGTISLNTQNSALPHNTITTLMQIKNGEVWVGTAAGVALVNNLTLKQLPLPANIATPWVTTLAQDNDNIIWLGTQKNGILKYDGNSFTHLTRQSGLRTNNINVLATDQEGNIWIGTNGYGLQQYKSPWFVHYFELDNIQEPRITGLAKDAIDRIWLGTDDGHAGYMQDGKINWLKTNLWPVGTSLYGMWAKNKDEVWVCTSQGVWQLKPENTVHYTSKNGLPADEVYYCAPDTAGNLWFATAKGLSCLRNGRFVNYTSVAGNALGAMAVIFKDSKSRLWFGGQQGIFQFVNGSIKPAATLQKYGFKDITTITEDQQGTLYFGGFNYGIMATHAKWKKPKVITSAAGLPNEGVTSLFADKSNNLWIGTSRYVLKLDLAELHQGKKLTFRSFDSNDGFKGMEVCNNAITQTKDGTIWFGTVKGLSKYLPHLDKQNRVYPNPVITDIRLFFKPVNWQKSGHKFDSVSGLPNDLELPYFQNHITFNFHGISLTNPDMVKYRYRLKGHEEQWSPVTPQSFATYASLTPGDYTFQLLAQNGDGYWTPHPLNYSFSITPPIWQREWFVGMVLLLVALAAISIVRLRERNLVKTNALLEMRVRHRTQLLEEKNREKEILIKEIHHRVKNNLQIVISMLNLQARSITDPLALEVMRSIRSRVRSMAILHEHLYQHEDLSHIDLDDYFRGICESLYASYGITTKQVTMQLNIPPIKMDIDSAITLGLIVNELVSNALKYAFQGRDGLLTLELQQQDNQQYTLTVSDNGIGIPPDAEQHQEKSFGLRLVSSLAKKLNGSFSFHSNKINGTKSIIVFVLPP
ncbi:two-component regulator propeller domain-containing protein [Pontibacter vulgaris]|uniref:two-component regulator propeller domain-containing protein n=1 Tax=Pontibacter vulgaris TaxID=2905679 RepID=UPI001FA7A4F8|nr:two-component regulator propeller domain-containing protein [Pontibacter vulgaris]